MTISPSAELLGVQTPEYLSLPTTAVSSAGREAVELAASVGLDLDPAQELVLEGALGERGDGRWAAFEVAVVEPRQNGKGALIEARELVGLFLLGEEQLLHTAHEFKTAAEGFRRVLGRIESTPDMERRVKRVRTSHGEEAIELRSGQRLRFLARSRGSGRGFSGDVVFLDEAYNLSPEGVAALLPTMSARPNPQLWYTSSSPLPHDVSLVLRRLCRRGRTGGSRRLAYFEWCARHDPKAPEKVDLDDRAEWARANPGLGIRIDDEFIEAEREAMDPETFARERLGVYFDDEDDEGIDTADWKATRNDEMVISKVVAFGVDVTPMQDRTSIVASGPTESGLAGVELVEHRFGTGWAVDRLVELRDRYGAAIVLDPAGPAGTLLADLNTKKVEPVLVTARQHAQGCGGFVNDLVERRLEHMTQGPLDEAVAGATKRPLGDLWLWDRKTSAIDISPLVAATLARWAAVAAPRKTLNPANYGPLEVPA